MQLATPGPGIIVAPPPSVLIALVTFGEPVLNPNIWALPPLVGATPVGSSVVTKRTLSIVPGEF